MLFAEVLFPIDISYGSCGGPVYSTDIITRKNGFEQRNTNWTQAKNRYNVIYGVKTAKQIENLLCFFRARKGKAQGFRYKDWTDYKAKNQIIAKADGKTKIFQLCKVYESGEYKEIRKITKPVKNRYIVYIDGTPIKNFDIDSTNGQLSFILPPAEGSIISADFEFDVPVRFDTDDLVITCDDFGLSSANEIPIIELKL